MKSLWYTYVIWSNWISRLSAILILRCIPSKKTTSFVSYYFSKPTFTHISGTKCPILMGFSAKCSLCTVVKDHAENSKLNVTDLRLILLNHITYMHVLHITSHRVTHAIMFMRYYLHNILTSNRDSVSKVTTLLFSVFVCFFAKTAESKYIEIIWIWKSAWLIPICNIFQHAVVLYDWLKEI